MMLLQLIAFPSKQHISKFENNAHIYLNWIQMFCRRQCERVQRLLHTHRSEVVNRWQSHVTAVSILQLPLPRWHKCKVPHDLHRRPRGEALKHKRYWHPGQPPPTRRTYLGHCSAIFHETQYMLRLAGQIKLCCLKAESHLKVERCKDFLKMDWFIKLTC